MKEHNFFLLLTANIIGWQKLQMHLGGLLKKEAGLVIGLLDVN